MDSFNSNAPQITSKDINREIWDATPAEELALLPRGEYVGRTIDGRLMTSQSKGTPGYQATFEIIEGKYAGRRLRHTLWLTEKALRRSKVGLAQLGIIDLQHLDSPPPELIFNLSVVVRKGDDEIERNEVARFIAAPTNPSPLDHFAPKFGNENGGVN